MPIINIMLNRCYTTSRRRKIKKAQPYVLIMLSPVMYISESKLIADVFYWGFSWHCRV